MNRFLKSSFNLFLLIKNLGDLMEPLVTQFNTICNKRFLGLSTPIQLNAFIRPFAFPDTHFLVGWWRWRDDTHWWWKLNVETYKNFNPPRQGYSRSSSSRWRSRRHAFDYYYYYTFCAVLGCGERVAKNILIKYRLVPPASQPAIQPVVEDIINMIPRRWSVSRPLQGKQ